MSRTAKQVPAPNLEARARRLAEKRAESARLPRDLQPLNLAKWFNPPPLPPGARIAPSPPEDPIMRHLKLMGAQSERLQLFLRLREEHGDVVRLNLGSVVLHLISAPDLVAEVLHSKHKRYNKQTRGLRKLRLVLGDGLLTSEGPSWFRNRRIAQPAFHRKRIAGFGDVMAKAAEEMCATWKDDQTLDAHNEMMKVTLRVIAETMLGVDITQKSDRVGKAVTHVIEDVNRRLNSLVDLPMHIPTPRNKAFAKAMGALDQVVLEIIEDRRAEMEKSAAGSPEDVAKRSEGDRPHNDLLSMFMSAEDAETGERMNNEQLRDEVMTVFLAGHETTANALSWALYSLSRSPAIARALKAEVRSVAQGRTLTAADVPALEQTARVLKESMRLYPPIWAIARSPNEDEVLGGYHIPKGSLVLLSPWVTHRHPEHWEDPEGFDPDRFLPERSENRAKFAYYPFGGGPRICIGNNFAMMESVLILATIMRDWQLDLVPGHPVAPEAMITLRPKNGLKVRAVKAKPASSGESTDAL